MSLGCREWWKLERKRFWRSPNLHKNLWVKIFYGIIFFFLAVEVLATGAGSYFLIREIFPDEDAFAMLNRYLYMVLFVMAALLFSLMEFKTESVKPFLLLPVRKRKLTLCRLVYDVLNPWVLLMAVWFVLAAWVFARKGYDAFGLGMWAAALILTLLLFTLLSWISERSTWMSFLFSFTLIALMVTEKAAPRWFRPLGDFYYGIYRGNFAGFLVLLAVTALTAWWVLRRTEKRLYLISGSRRRPVRRHIPFPSLAGRGQIGAFLLNDLRLIWRNNRAKLVIHSSLFMLLFAAFVFYSPLYRDNRFMYVFTALFVTATFMINYGSMVPAWDSEYFKLLMSQSISYRRYLEAKWWLMVISAGVFLVLALPLLYFGTDIFKMIAAFALFNAGVTVYLVMVTGLLNTKPVRLHDKVSAFGSSRAFDGKLFALSLLRLGLPLLYFFLLEKWLGTEGALWVTALTGMAGLLMKDKMLDLLARWYNRRKYVMIESFSQMDET
ncbi:MAG: hypothetical protein GXO27_03675 [Chlorobi bacterium]|nr:hypothetical protein [Chlorobiota bacterium]